MAKTWSDEIETAVLRIGKRDNAPVDLWIGALLAIATYDLEDDAWEYLEKHPNTTFDELDEFIVGLCPPIEIVPDDEMDDEE